MGFLAEHRLGHVGPIQAYLLVELLGSLLIRGARTTGIRARRRA